MQRLTSEIVKNKRVLVRVDFNVEFDQRGKIIDDFRIQRILPTIKFLQDSQAQKIILISHLGQPTAPDHTLSLEPVAHYLERLLSEKIYFFPNAINDDLNQQIQALGQSSLILLENLRFNPGESGNDKVFARALSQLADLFINEAFSVSHRSAASIDAIAEFLPCYPGFLLEEEVKSLNQVINPEHPLVVILGGDKIEDKLPLIETFIAKANWILTGGAIANTILKAWDFEIGDSLYEEQMIAQAKNLGSQAAELVLPGDFFVLTSNQQTQNRALGQVEKGDKILDIGPITRRTFGKIIQKAGTIFWNGTMGQIEDGRFQDGTRAIIEAILANQKAKIIVGGGHTLMAFKILKPAYKIENTEKRFFSTGGGAMLQYLSGKNLPGLKILTDNL